MLFQSLTPIHLFFFPVYQMLIRKVHDMIVTKGRREQTIWFSLSEDINADLRAYDRTIPNISSVSGMLKVNRQACVCVFLLPLLSPPSPVCHSLLLFVFTL